jgi:hypothetical protein
MAARRSAAEIAAAGNQPDPGSVVAATGDHSEAGPRGLGTCLD